MPPGISNNFLRQTFQRNFVRFLPVQKHVNKSSAYHTVCCHRQQEKTRRDYTFVNNRAWKTMSHASMPLCASFQIRNISNVTGALKNNEQSLDVQSDVSEQAVDAIVTNLPIMFKNVSSWKIVELAQEALLKVHETTGLPWWASIALSALVARTIVTLPFSIITIQNSAKLEKVRSEMDEVAERLKKEANYAVQVLNWPQELARREYDKAVVKEYKELRESENCHPAKSFILIWIQLPMWFAFSVATRNLCYMLPKPDHAAQITFMEMSVGGFAWVPNLVTPDHTLILPIALGLANLAVLEVHRLFRTTPPRKIDWYLTNFFRFISLLMIAIASYLPAATNVYWLTSSTFGLLQTFVLQSTKLRRVCGIPIVKSELEHPYRYFYGNLKSKL